MIYAVLRMGKLMFGRQKLKLPPDTKVIFTETAVCLPDQEIPYDELFYRKSDAIVLSARTMELVDRGYKDVTHAAVAIGAANRRGKNQSRRRRASGGGLLGNYVCRARRWAWAT